MTVRALAVVAVVAVALSGCRGNGPAALIDGASAALEAAETSRFEMEAVTAGEPGSRVVASGAQDLTTGALRMSLELDDGAVATETLLLGADVFVRGPVFELFTGDPTMWVRIDLAAAADDAGLDVADVASGHTGPAAMLAQLDGTTDEVEELGREDVRGTATRRLRVTVDIGAVLERADPEVREQLRAYARDSGLPATYPVDLWIDDAGLVRRIRTILDVPRTPEDGAADGAGAADGVTQQTTLELFDFGVSVDLQPPQPERTIDLRELIADLEALEGLDDRADG